MVERDSSRYAVVLGRILAEGPLYTFHEISGTPDRWAKSVVDSRVKGYPLGVTIRYPGQLYVKIKYGVSDLAEHEFRQWSSMPPELHRYLLKGVRLEQSQTGQRLLCSDRVRDCDGTYSRTLSQTGKVSNPGFWSGVTNIRDVLRSSKIYLLGVFHGGSQILVHKVSPDHWEPVILDVTKLGRQMYPFQLNLWRKRALEKKFERQFGRFCERFCGEPK